MLILLTDENRQLRRFICSRHSSAAVTCDFRRALLAEKNLVVQTFFLANSARRNSQ
jgi:hypothetical protein